MVPVPGVNEIAVPAVKFVERVGLDEVPVLIIPVPAVILLIIFEALIVPPIVKFPETEVLPVTVKSVVNGVVGFTLIPTFPDWSTTKQEVSPMVSFTTKQLCARLLVIVNVSTIFTSLAKFTVEAPAVIFKGAPETLDKVFILVIL